MPLQGNLSIERMCQLARVSRASFYRSFHQRQPAEEGLEVRTAIREIATENRRRYGYRRISAELRRRGMQVNHKGVMRIMAEDNLLAVQPKSFVVTTNTDHEFEPGPGLVHHSNRGLQYASTEYVEVLRKHQMISSMEPASESL